MVETLEDMSLSSNSSLDTNDTSQEYMDDFDNLGKESKDSNVMQRLFAVFPALFSHVSSNITDPFLLVSFCS